MGFSRGLAVALLFFASNAAIAGGGLSYSYIQASYVTIDPDDVDVDIDGFAGSFSASVAESIFLIGSYAIVETEDLDPSPAEATAEEKDLSIGLGFRAPLSPQADLNLGASFIKADVSTTGSAAGFIDEDDTGYALFGGLRFLATPSLELSGGVTSAKIFDDTSTSFSLGALIHFGQVSVGAGYSSSDDADGLAATIRLNL